MKFFDLSEYASPIVCGVSLFINHGLRDYLVTGLSTFKVNLINSEGEAFTRSNYTKSENGSFSNENSGVQPASNSNLFYPHYAENQDDWDGVTFGGILGSVHIGIFIAVILSPFTISRISKRYFLAITLISSGIISLFSELAVRNRYLGLSLLRLVQGLLQGSCYPLIFFTLQDMNLESFVLPFFLIFLAPWLGSAIGILLGWCDDPFMGAYVFGSLSVVTGALSLLTSVSNSDETEMPKNAWKECLTSPAVWACLFVCMSTVWSLHSIIVGLPFTLHFWLEESDALWFVSIVILIGGIVTRLEAIAAMHLLRNNFLSPLNRRRCIILVGTLIVTLSLVLNGTVGLNSKYTLCAISILGIGGVAGLLLVGIRLNLHDLGPLYPAPFLIIGSLSGTLGAALATFLFPILGQIQQIDSDNEKPWKVAWMVPIIPVVVSCIVHVFLLSVIPLPHQTVITKTIVPILKPNDPDKKEELDTRSFKSTKSAMSFRTAVSRPRTRTISFQTVEDMNISLQSFPESNSDDCVSYPSNEDENGEMKSIKSAGTSFKSAPDSGNNSVNSRQDGLVLNVGQLERTSQWLSVHHEVGKKLQNQISVEKVTAERNILIALQW